MARIRLLALVLSLAIAPAFAADTPDAIDPAVQKKLDDAQAAMNAGHKAEALQLVGEATRIADNGAMAHKLGHYYEGSTDVPDHDALATKWFQFAVDHDDAESMHHVGMRYMEGKGGLPRDTRKGIALLNASAKADYMPAYSFMSNWRQEQDTKGRCMLAALRGYDMREVIFGQDRFYDFSDGNGDAGGGDTYLIRGIRDNSGIELGDPDEASLDVDGFSHAEYTEVDGRHFYNGTYDARRPSSAAVQRAAEVRAKCNVAER